MPFYCINPDCWGKEPLDPNPSEVSEPGQLCERCKNRIPQIIQERGFEYADQFDIIEFEELDSSILEEPEPITAFYSSGKDDEHFWVKNAHTLLKEGE